LNESQIVARCPTDGKVTVVLTSCDRADLLLQTLNSFFEFNTCPIAGFVLVEDGPMTLDVVKSYSFPCEHRLISTGERVGQIAAIDYAYSHVSSEYIFHLEDDWQFYAPGFIEKSLQLLKTLPLCLQVYIRALNDTNGHPVQWRTRHTAGIAWRRMRYGYKAFGGEWNGFSFNPGLRRLADYVAVGGYGVHKLNAPHLHAGTEIVLSRLYRRKEMFAAILADRGGKGYVRHIGWDRTVPEPG
jgi:hypothetical protein